MFYLLVVRSREVKPRLQLVVLHYPIYDSMKIDYYIGDANFHRSLANFVRNFVIHSKQCDFR